MSVSHVQDLPQDCDWRIHVTDCQGSEFFRPAFIASAVLISLCLLLMILLFAYRIFIRKDDLNSFLFGANATLLGVFGNASVDLAYRIVVLFSTNRMMIEIAWALSITLLILPPSLYMSSFLDGLPEALLQSSPVTFLKRLFPRRRDRSFALYSFLSFLLIGLCTLYGLMAQFHKSGDHVKERLLFRAAAGFATANFVLFFLIFWYIAHIFRNVLRKAMKLSKDPALQMNYKKISANTFILGVNLTTYTLTTLLMAFLPSFFEVFYLSRILGIIFIFELSVGCLFALFGIIAVDISKIVESKKETLSRQSSLVLQIQGKELIEETKAKEQP